MHELDASTGSNKLGTASLAGPDTITCDHWPKPVSNTSNTRKTHLRLMITQKNRQMRLAVVEFEALSVANLARPGQTVARFDAAKVRKRLVTRSSRLLAICGSPVSAPSRAPFQGWSPPSEDALGDKQAGPRPVNRKCCLELLHSLSFIQIFVLFTCKPVDCSGSTRVLVGVNPKSG